MFGDTGPHTHQWVAADSLRKARMRDHDDVFSPYQSMHEEMAASEAHRRARSQSKASDPLSRQLSTMASYHATSEQHDVIPQEIAHHNETTPRDSKGLVEGKSTFFGSTTFTGAKTASPYRRALAERSQVNESEVGRPPLPVSPTRQLPPPARERTDGSEGKTYSESIYSRTTSGLTPAAANSALSLLTSESIPEMPFPPTTTGDAIIIDTATYRPTMPSSAHRVTSSAGSIEWRKWMSSEVAKLERAKENRPSKSASYVNYALPTVSKAHLGRHVREHAQISGEVAEIGAGKVPSMRIRAPSSNKQALGAPHPDVQAQSSSPLPKPILKNKYTVSLVENTDPGPAPRQAPTPPPPPPIPERSPLRTMQSRSSIRTVSTVGKTSSAADFAVKVASINGKNVLHKRNASSTTLRSVKSFETPGKLIKRNRQTSSQSVSMSGRVEKQPNSMSSRARTPARENHIRGMELEDDTYDTDGAGLLGPRVSGAQSLGSKRMVEEFLNSRRKRIASGNEGNGPVFI